MMKKIGIHFGALAPPIEEQLAEQEIIGLDQNILAIWQEAADSISFLYLHDVLTDGQRTAAHKKLMNKISKGVERHG